MNFPHFLLVFSSLLGRNDEKNGTNLVPKINRTVDNVNIVDINPITYESSISNDVTTTTAVASNKEINFRNRINSCQENLTVFYDLSNKFILTKNCTCDDKCSIYNDCCEDSIYRDKYTNHDTKFTCTKTSFNGSIYMVDKCPSGYIDLETVYKCERSMSSKAFQDISLISPVTSTNKNITYRNSFCAICNNQLQYDIWVPILYYELDTINDTAIIDGFPKSTDVANISMILSNLVVENDTILISKFNNLNYKCSLLTNMPIKLKSFARYCHSDEPAGNKIYSHSNLIELDRYNLPEILKNRKSKLDFDHDINIQIKTCVYSVATSGDICLVNKFFSKDSEIVYLENDAIFIKKYNVVFDRTEYSNETMFENTVYVCGIESPDESKLHSDLKVFLARLSSFLIIVLLALNANEKNLQSLSDKMTYAYCVTMLLVYGAFEMHRHPKWCLFTEEAMHYFFLSHFIWFLATSYELWNVICRLSVKFQSTTGKSHTKRFIIYCLICWITPLPVIPLTMYYRQFVNNPTNCPAILGYKIRRPCLTIPESPIGMYVFFINSVIICINVSLFVHVCYHIYLTKRRNVKSTSHNNYLELFFKLALTMDLQWLFYLFSFSDIDSLKMVNTMLNSSHGLITFLAYGIKKSTFVNFYKKYKNHFGFIQKIRNSLTLIFGEVKRVPLFKRNSVEPSTRNTEVDLLSNV